VKITGMYAPFPAKISLCSGLECSQALGLTADDSLRTAVGGCRASGVVFQIEDQRCIYCT
jgi:hypothetical protein